MKIKKISVFSAILLLSVVAFFVYRAFQPPVKTYNVAEVSAGDILQEISETGSITKGEAVNLNFKSSGTIAKISVLAGQKVFFGEALAELDSSDLKLRVAQAQASMNLVAIKLDRLMNGASSQDKKIAESRVNNARIASQNAGQNLADAQKTADEKIANAYDDAVDVLTDAYEKAYNAQNFASLLQRTYFTPQGEDGIKVYENVQLIKTETDEIKADMAAASKSGSAIDSALKSASANIDGISEALRDVRDICEKAQWRDNVSETDKTSLDAHRALIGGVAATLTSASQAITSQLVASGYSVNTATSALNAANSQLQSSQDEYDGIAAPPRSEDVALLNTQAAQSKTEYELLQNELSNMVLRSPVDGEVISVNKRAGEIAQPLAGDPVMIVLPIDPFEIDVDIYEEDVVKLKIGDPVRITLTAFPDKVFPGRVSFIDPAEKLVNGVVYYPIKIDFTDTPSGLKTGMSVDVAIDAVLAINAVIIPESALQKDKSGSYFVQVMNQGIVTKKTVAIGARSKTEIEILSGLAAGESVIIP